MDKMREEFEAWFWDYHHKDCTKDYWSVVFAIGCDGKYQGIACEGAWQGWQASRAALCVEFPESIYEEWEDQIGAFEAGACMTAMQLDGTGVNVNNKPGWYDAQVAEYKNKPLA